MLKEPLFEHTVKYI